MEEGAHHWVAYQVCQRTVGAVTSIARRHKVRAAFSQRTGKGTDPVSDIGGEVSVEANQVFGPDFDHVLQRSSQCRALATAAGKLRFNAVCHWRLCKALAGAICRAAIAVQQEAHLIPIVRAAASIGVRNHLLYGRLLV
jgi:hypothetical protein